MSEEWLDFIIECRSGKSYNYDIVIGVMADDQIYNYISDYMDGTITREQFWVLARFKYPTHQIVFCSDEALKCLRYRGYEVAQEEGKAVIDALIEVYNSFLSPKIDDYNSSVYYENPSYIFECYREKVML